VLRHTLQFLEADLDHIIEGCEAFPDLVLRNIEDGLFRHVQEFFGRLPVLEARIGDDGALTDELSPHGEVPDDLRVKQDACGSGHGLHKRSQVVRSSGLIQGVFLFEVLRKGDEVDGLVVIVQFSHPLKETQVSFPIEIVRRENVHDLIHGIIVDEDSGQNSLLRLDVLRGDFESSGNDLLFHLGHPGILFPERPTVPELLPP
jgi:hypothetical protein